LFETLAIRLAHVAVGLAEDFSSLLFCRLGMAVHIARRINLLPQGRPTR
jgi:hypothetical protein